MPNFHEELQLYIDDFAHSIYKLSKKFPKEELYGITSQIRRAALSVPLNYKEGFARNRNLVLINFLEISYGSLQECKYLLNFSFKENYINETDFHNSMDLADKIGGMLWGTIRNLKKKS